MISSKEVQHIAKLARIALSDREMVQFQKEFTSLLEYFEILGELDTSAVEPMTHPVLVENVGRQDTAKPGDVKTALLLLDMAPETKDGYLKVKEIMKRES